MCKQMLENYAVLFNPAAKRITYIYGMWQKDFAKRAMTILSNFVGINQILEDGNFFWSRYCNFISARRLDGQDCNNKTAAALFALAS